MSDNSNLREENTRRRGGVKYQDDEEMLYSDAPDDYTDQPCLQPSSHHRKAGQAPPNSQSQSNDAGSTHFWGTPGEGAISIGKFRSQLRRTKFEEKLEMPDPLHLKDAMSKFEGKLDMPDPLNLKGAISGISAPLTNIFTGKGNIGEEHRIYGMTDSVTSEYDSSNINLDGTMSEIDMMMNNSARMYCINEGDTRTTSGSNRSAGGSYLSTGSNSSTSDMEYDNRVRDKMMKGGNIYGTAARKPGPSTENAAAHHRTLSDQSPTANSQFEARLKAKMEEGKKYAARKPSPSMENTAASHHRTVSEPPLSASARYAQRIKEKMERGNDSNGTAMKPSPSMGSAASAYSQAGGGQSATTSDQYEKRVHAKTKQANAAMKSSPTPAHQRTISEPPHSASSRYEQRIKEKMKGGNDNNNTGTKPSPSMASAASAHSQAGIMQSSSANDQYEKRVQANSAMKASPSSADQRTVSEAPHSASSRYEQRIKEKMKGGSDNNNNAMKPSPSMNSAATSSSAGDQFENRLRAKMEEGSAGNAKKPSLSTEYVAGAHHRPTGDPSSTASDQYENRLKAKLEKGSAGNAKKPNPSTEYVAGAHRRSTGDSSSTASDQFESRLRAKVEEGSSLKASNQLENRLKAKMEKGSTGNAKKPTPSTEYVAGAHRRPTADSASSAGDQFENRLRANIKEGPISKASDQFENRLKAKMEKGSTGNAKKPTPSMEYVAGAHRCPTGDSASSAGDQFENRLKANIKEGSSSKASNQFENRLKAKMEEGSTGNAKKPTPSMEYVAGAHRCPTGDSASSAGDQIENRLRAKMEEGSSNNAKKPTPSTEYAAVSAGASPSTSDHKYRMKEKVDGTAMKPSPSSENISADDRFRDRLRAKAAMGSKDNTTGMKPSNSMDYSLDDSRFVDKRSTKKMGKDSESSQQLDAGCAVVDGHAEEGRYEDILQYLNDNPSISPALVSHALEKISNGFPSAHGAFDCNLCKGEENSLNANWVNILAVTMKTHYRNETVQIAALRAIWSIVALRSSYASEFTSSGIGLDYLIEAMGQHQHNKRIQQCGSGLVACLASNQEQATCLLQFQDGAIVRRMGQALYSNSQGALNALAKLLSASIQKETTGYLIETIANSSNRERQGGNTATYAMDTVLSVMSDYPKNSGVQMWGCLLLWTLFDDKLHALRFESGSFSLSTQVSDILRHLEAITTSPQSSRAVYESAICLLSRISCCSEDVLVGGKNRLISGIAIGTMLTQPKSRIVAMQGCHCISNVLFIEDDTSGAVTEVMRGFDDEEVAAIAINTIALLTKMGFQAIVTLLRNKKLIDTIVVCMTRYPKSSSVQIAACDILSTIALDRQVMSDICSCGGAGGIISALYNLSQDRLVVCKAFLALTNLIGICDPAILRESRGPKSVLCAMEAHPSDLSIQIRGATSLWNIASSHQSLQKEIVQSGGINTISEAMGTFIASKQMQEKGIISLWTLASSPSLEPAVTACAIESITDAVSAHLTCAQICQHGMGALSMLASSKAVVKDTAIVIDLIMSCMWMHSYSASIQQGALAALSKISIDQPTNRILEITPEDLDVVTSAMRTHLRVKDVQENAIILIRSFTYCPKNIRVLGQNVFLVGLIKSAMSNFRGSLRVNAQDLLRLLASDNQ